LPCRILITVKGVEAFFFNRTPAYDAIVERMKKHEAENANAAHSTGSFTSATSSRESKDPDGLRKRANVLHRDRKLSKESSTQSDREYEILCISSSPSAPPAPSASPTAAAAATGVNWFREALPIDLDIESGSVVLGSDASPMVLIGDFKRANGTLHVTDVSDVVLGIRWGTAC
jgi:hypothetical protein